MPSRLFFQRLLFSVCLALALFGTRAAWAAAPICDERGASAIAPPPVLPIRDVRLEPSSPLACLELDDVDGPAFVTRDASRIPTADGVAADAWIVPPVSPPLPVPSTIAAVDRDVTGALPLGHRSSVFRPPRV
jgi:hypothetical protein